MRRSCRRSRKGWRFRGRPGLAAQSQRTREPAGADMREAGAARPKIERVCHGIAQTQQHVFGRSQQRADACKVGCRIRQGRRMRTAIDAKAGDACHAHRREGAQLSKQNARELRAIEQDVVRPFQAEPRISAREYRARRRAARRPRQSRVRADAPAAPHRSATGTRKDCPAATTRSARAGPCPAICSRATTQSRPGSPSRARRIASSLVEPTLSWTTRR